MDNGLKSCGALWVKDGNKGKFFSGEIEFYGVKQHILIFRNDKGGVEKRPDYKIYMPVEEESPQEPAKTENEFEDDVPF